MLLEAVRRAMYWDVDGAVALGAVRGAVYWAVYRGAYQPVSQAMSRAMRGARRGAGAPHEEPPHPGLERYLGGVP